MSRNAFGQLMRDLRRQSGKNLGDIARILKCSVAYVSAVERGERGPYSVEDTKRLLSRLDMTDRWPEASEAMVQSRRAVEIKVHPQKNHLVDMFSALARASDDNLIDQEKAKRILAVLKERS